MGGFSGETISVNLTCADPLRMVAKRNNRCYNVAWLHAPIAQRIECGPPEAEAQVRVLVGA